MRNLTVYLHRIPGVTRCLWKGDDQQQTTGKLWSESSMDHSAQVSQSIMLKFYMMLHWKNRYSIAAPAARKTKLKLYDATVKIKDWLNVFKIVTRIETISICHWKAYCHGAVKVQYWDTPILTRYIHSKRHNRNFQNVHPCWTETLDKGTVTFYVSSNGFLQPYRCMGRKQYLLTKATVIFTKMSLFYDIYQ